jgi:hypothetical protein
MSEKDARFGKISLQLICFFCFWEKNIDKLWQYLLLQFQKASTNFNQYLSNLESPFTYYSGVRMLWHSLTAVANLNICYNDFLTPIKNEFVVALVQFHSNFCLHYYQEKLAITNGKHLNDKTPLPVRDFRDDL